MSVSLYFWLMTAHMKKYWTSGVMIEITREKPGDKLYYSSEEVDAYRAETGATIHALQRGYEQQVVRIAELEKALRDLLEDTQHAGHDCGDTPDNCPVLRARSLMENGA